MLTDEPAPRLGKDVIFTEEFNPRSGRDKTCIGNPDVVPTAVNDPSPPNFIFTH
jgi:hypothetical protein